MKSVTLIFTILLLTTYVRSWIKSGVFFKIEISPGEYVEVQANDNPYYSVFFPDSIVKEKVCASSRDSNSMYKYVILTQGFSEFGMEMTPTIYEYIEERDSIAINMYGEEDYNCEGESLLYMEFLNGVIYDTGTEVEISINGTTKNANMTMNFEYIDDSLEDPSGLRNSSLTYKWTGLHLFDKGAGYDCNEDSLSSNKESYFSGANVVRYIINGECKIYRNKILSDESVTNYVRVYSNDDVFMPVFFSNSSCNEEDLLYYHIFPIKGGECNAASAYFEFIKEAIEEIPFNPQESFVSNGNFMEVTIFPDDTCGNEISRKWDFKSLLPIAKCTSRSLFTNFINGEHEGLANIEYRDDECVNVTGFTVYYFIEFGECMTDYEVRILNSFFNYNQDSSTSYLKFEMVDDYEHLLDYAVIQAVRRDECLSETFEADYSESTFNFVHNPDVCETRFLGSTDSGSSYRVECITDSNSSSGRSPQMMYYTDEDCQVKDLKEIKDGEFCYTSLKDDGNLYWHYSCMPMYCYGFFANEEGVCSGNGKCIGMDRCFCDSGMEGDDCSENNTVEPSLNIALVVSISSFSLFIIFIVVCACLSMLSVLYCYIVYQKKKYKEAEIILREQELDDWNSGEPRVSVNSKFFNIEMNDLKKLKVIGEGGSDTTVYLAEWNKKLVALKSFKTMFLCDESHDYTNFEKEVEIMSSLLHPNLITFFGVVFTPKVGIVMQYCPKGDLKNYLTNYEEEHKKRLPLEHKLKILEEISSGMAFLHKKNVIHRDLKPENILIDETDTVRIMDFGLSTIVRSDTQEKTIRVGTSFYMAPEMNTPRYDEKVDVFSFAILSYVALTENFLPYGDNSRMKEAQVRNDPNYRPDLTQITYNEKWLIELIEHCWNHESVQRPPFKEIETKLRDKRKEYKKSENNVENLINTLRERKEEGGILKALLMEVERGEHREFESIVFDFLKDKKKINLMDEQVEEKKTERKIKRKKRRTRKRNKKYYA